jgi:hypothetical protein
VPWGSGWFGPSVVKMLVADECACYKVKRVFLLGGLYKKKAPRLERGAFFFESNTN